MEEKLYLEPKGINGLPLHKSSSIGDHMKGYTKKVGILLTKDELKSILIHGVMLGSGHHQLNKELDIDAEFERYITKK